MENIEIGIWTINRYGITCNRNRPSEGNISQDFIWATLNIKSNMVWDIPIHIAHKTWATKKDVNDLMEAMAIHRRQYPSIHRVKNTDEIDKRTHWLSQAIIDSRNDSDSAS